MNSEPNTLALHLPNPQKPAIRQRHVDRREMLLVIVAQ